MTRTTTSHGDRRTREALVVVHVQRAREKIVENDRDDVEVAVVVHVDDVRVQVAVLVGVVDRLYVTEKWEKAR